MRQKKFVVTMRLITLEDVKVQRWILAQSRKEAQKIAELIYPFLVILNVSNGQIPSPAERYWWRFKRWHRPNENGVSRRR